MLPRWQESRGSESKQHVGRRRHRPRAIRCAREAPLRQRFTRRAFESTDRCYAARFSDAAGPVERHLEQHAHHHHAPAADSSAFPSRSDMRRHPTACSSPSATRRSSACSSGRAAEDTGDRNGHIDGGLDAIRTRRPCRLESECRHCVEHHLCVRRRPAQDDRPAQTRRCDRRWPR